MGKPSGCIRGFASITRIPAGSLLRDGRPHDQRPASRSPASAAQRLYRICRDAVRRLPVEGCRGSR